MSVGSTLAAVRREQGLTVDEVSARTRIRPHLIRAIEADDFASCGGDVYARGHVRALARALGTPPEPLLEEMAQGRSAGTGPIRAPALDPSLVIRERRVAPRWSVAMAVILGIVVCLAALRLVVPGDGGGDRAGNSQLRQGQGQPYVRPTSPSPSPVTAAPQNGVAVTFTVTGRRCWVSVTASDGTVKVAEVLRRGQVVSFRDKRRLSVVVGSVGDVQVAVNGRVVTVPGAAGTVKRFVVRAKDPLADLGSPSASPGQSAPAA